MVNQDLVSALKNALDRGYPLDKAKQSFINAGYSREEVEEAAQFVHSNGVPVYSDAEEEKPQISRAVQPSKPGKPESGGESFFKKHPKIFILSGILIILIIILILTFIFKDKIAGLFS